MKIQNRNKVMSSFYLWFDHELLNKGEAYDNISTYFFDVPDEYSAYNTYGLPYKQIVSDTSIAGAQVMSGVYEGQEFKNVGSGNLVEINYNEGWTYYSATPSGSLSGDYAVKEFSVSITDTNEEDLLFETKYNIRPKTYETPTGLAINEITIPHIFLKGDGGRNDPFCFGGMEQTQTNIRAIVIAQDQFALDAVESIFIDTRGKHIRVLEQDEMPFNTLGGWISGKAYNYVGLCASSTGELMYVNEVFVSKINNSSVNKALSQINPYARVSFVDFELQQERFPRL